MHHFNGWLPLRRKCPYSELFWAAYSRICTEYWEIRSISAYSVWMWKNVNQKNSKYGTFHAVYNSEFWHYKAIPIYTSSVSLVKVSIYFWNRAKVWNLWMKPIQGNVHLNACLPIFIIGKSLLIYIFYYTLLTIYLKIVS